MNKLLFFSLCLLTSISAISMESQEWEKSDWSKSKPNDWSKPNKEINDRKQILEKFNKQIDVTYANMNSCSKTVLRLIRNTYYADGKNKFNKENAIFKETYNNLYSEFLIPQTPTSRICVGSPAFHEFIALTKNTLADLEKINESVNDEIRPFCARVQGLLDSLNHVKAEVEKK
jgi:hypothetical protein